MHQIMRKKYDQERNFTIAVHPVIESNYLKIAKSKEIILSELHSIEKYDDLDQFRYLQQYINGLGETKFDSLFMVIFIARLKKHCPPRLEHQTLRSVGPNLSATS